MIAEVFHINSADFLLKSMNGFFLWKAFMNVYWEKLRRPFRILGSEQKLEDPRHQWQAVQCKANIYHCNSTLFCTALYRDSMTGNAHGMLNSTLTCNITAFRSSALFFCIQLYIYSTVHIAIAVCRHALQVTVTVRCQSLQRFLNALIE